MQCANFQILAIATQPWLFFFTEFKQYSFKFLADRSKALYRLNSNDSRWFGPAIQRLWSYQSSLLDFKESLSNVDKPCIDEVVSIFLCDSIVLAAEFQRYKLNVEKFFDADFTILKTFSLLSECFSKARSILQIAFYVNAHLAVCILKLVNIDRIWLKNTFKIVKLLQFQNQKLILSLL